MPKTQSKNDYTTLTERIILASCAAAIGLAFGLLGFFYTFSWAFLVVLVIDLVVLVRGKLAETMKRLVMLVSIVAALLAIFFVVIPFTR